MRRVARRRSSTPAPGLRRYRPNSPSVRIRCSRETGSYDVTAGQGDDTFVFASTLGGGSSTITGFGLGVDKIDLQGYGKNEVANALKHQQINGTSDTIKLSDNTTITFAGISSLTASDFITSGNGGSGGGGMDHGGNGDHGHGSQNGDDHSHMKDAVFKPNS